MALLSVVRSVKAVALATAFLAMVPVSVWAATAPRPWPNTTNGIHVFNDQLSSGLSDAQAGFAATNYAGSQKLLRRDADQIRSHNSNFMVLHYRLGHGLGYRVIQNGCEPTGGFIHFIEGNEWVREWPDGGGDAAWFVEYGGNPRVLNCDWGWYLMDIGNSGWRNYWHGEVLRQLRANDNDGVFMDSLSVPNYLGAGSYSPRLPDVDSGFEGDWSSRITNWIAWLQGQAVGGYYLVPNVGSWITSRETTDYTGADGVMVEGFALENDRSPYNLEDWRLQVNRILGLVSRGKAIIGQNYATGSQERMFSLGTYLLVKGGRTFINIDSGEDPEWWPEYDIGIGSPTESAGTNIENLAHSSDGIYRRLFDNGIVLVNATNPWDGTAKTQTVNLDKTYYLAKTSGGGTVPESGAKPGSVSYEAVNSVTLGPYSAAVVLGTPPTKTTNGIKVKFLRPRLKGRSRRLMRRTFAKYLKRGLKAKISYPGAKIKRVRATVVRKKGKRCYRLNRPRKRTSCKKTYLRGVLLRERGDSTVLTYRPMGSGKRARHSRKSRRILRRMQRSKRALPNGRYRIRLKVYTADGKKKTFNYLIAIRR